MVVDDSWVVEAPSHLSAVESASLVTAGTTAWSAIRNGLDLKLDGTLGPWEGTWQDKRLEGKTILTMGTGGVSCFAIQVCHPTHSLLQSSILNRIDRFRPRRNCNCNLLIRQQTRLCEITGCHACCQLHRDPRVGETSPRTHKRQRRRSRHRNRRRRNSDEVSRCHPNGRTDHLAGYFDAKRAYPRRIRAECVIWCKDR
jgi:hypothetical protein